jgi:hypothetical protein
MTTMIDKILNNVDKQPEQSLDAVGMLSIAINIFRHAPTADIAVNTINRLTNYDKTLRTAEGEYVFVFKVFQNPFTGMEDFVFLTHSNTHLINRVSTIVGDILKDISSKVDIIIDPPKNELGMLKAADWIENKDCSKQFLKYFNSYDYQWYDPNNLNVILKRTFAVKYQKDGTQYLIATGFTLDEVAPEILKKNAMKTKVQYGILAGMLLIGTLIFYLLGTLQWSKDRVAFLISAGLIMYVMIVSAYSYSYPSSFELELAEYNELNLRILTMASIVLGVSILMINVSQRYKMFNVIFIRYLLSGFFFSLVALIIPIFRKTGLSVHMVILTQRCLLNLSIALIIYSILYVFRNIRI